MRVVEERPPGGTGPRFRVDVCGLEEGSVGCKLSFRSARYRLIEDNLGLLSGLAPPEENEFINHLFICACSFFREPDVRRRYTIYICVKDPIASIPSATCDKIARVSTLRTS